MARTSLKARLLTALLTLAAGVAVLVTGTPANAQDAAADQFKAMKDAALLACRGGGEGLERGAKVAKLGEVDTPEAAKAILECLEALAVKQGASAQSYEGTKKQYEPYKGFAFKNPSDWDIKKRLQKQLSDLEESLASDSVVAQVFATTIGKLRNPAGVTVVEKASAVASVPFTKGVLYGGLLRNPGARTVDLAKKALKDPDPEIRLAAGEALLERKDAATVDLLVKLLAEKDTPIRQVAVVALGAIGDVRAVLPLVTAMQTEDGSILEEYAKSLQALTGQNLGTFPEPWRKWYDDNKKALEEQGAKGGATPRASGKGDPAKMHYYGVETLSKKILFIMDISGSMKEPLGQDKGPVTGEKQETYSGLKIDVAKKVLTKAIRNLPDNAQFEVILFNHQFKTVFGAMTLATIENKNKAELEIEAAKPVGATWTYGAMREAFEIAKRGVTEDQIQPAVDTIFLLSDGAPTDDASDTEAKPMAPKVIIDAVQEWNRLLKVKIHTIAIDPSLNGSNFILLMKGLAAKNGGTYTPIGSK